MLDVVAGKHRIDRGIGDSRHIEHGANNIGTNALVDIEAQFCPRVGIKAARRLVLAFRAAANREKNFHRNTRKEIYTPVTEQLLLLYNSQRAEHLIPLTGTDTCASILAYTYITP